MSMSSVDVVSAISNSTAETDLFSASIPAGKLGLEKTLALHYVGRLTTGLLPPAVTIKVYLGSSSLTVFTAVALLASGSKPLVLDVRISNVNSMSAQYVSVVGQYNTSCITADADWTVDTTTAQTLRVTAQFVSLSTSTSIQTKEAVLEIS
ncbi:hypothetical protein [Spirosoma sordidisoli]|nr:hypothetical protein [Spirosoma sordidisoli]